jgi:hypothetical protein
LLQSSGDPRLQGYVKWQLLSALPEALDEKLAPKFLAAYRAAPPPAPRPGISQIERQQLDRAVQGKKGSEEGELQSQFDAAVSKNRQGNQPILAYRNELYRKLPKALDTFAASLDDAYERFHADADAKPLLKDLDRDVRGWAVGGKSPSSQSMLALARAVRKLAGEKGPEFYKTLYYSEPKHSLVWRKAHADLGNEKALADLAVFLEEQALAPPLKTTPVR